MSESKRRAIWFTPEAAAELDNLANQLASQLGFKPTPSQIIQHLIKGRQPLDDPKKQVSVP